MSIEVLYESQYPGITITHDTDTGSIVLNRSDKYMRNPNEDVPAFVPECVTLFNTNNEV